MKLFHTYRPTKRIIALRVAQWLVALVVVILSSSLIGTEYDYQQPNDLDLFACAASALTIVYVPIHMFFTPPEHWVHLAFEVVWSVLWLAIFLATVVWHAAVDPRSLGYAAASLAGLNWALFMATLVIIIKNWRQANSSTLAKQTV